MMAESQPLFCRQTMLQTIKAKACTCSYLCFSSKGAVFVIIWTAIVGAVYSFITTSVAIDNLRAPHYYKPHTVTIGSLLYMYIAVMMLLYPVSGFIADIHYGRFKTIMISLGCTSASIILLCLCAIILSGKFAEGGFKFRDLFQQEEIPIGILLITAILIFTIGIIGYQANFIQFGLDQLLEARSEHLGLFVHYNSFTFNFSASLSKFFIETLLYTSSLIQNYYSRKFILSSVALILTTVLLLLLVLNYKKRQWFYTQPGQQNPYKTVYKVLNFARKNKYPPQRSAFTYFDDYIPSRIDYAKERYGGPFTTEQVENVKTLLRILLLLVSLGPAYVLTVPASMYVFPLFGYHTGYEYANRQAMSKLIENGLLGPLTTNILFPLYIWYVYSFRRYRMPKMLSRLKLGIFVSLLGVISMLIIDIVGHSINAAQPSNHTESQCLFQVTTIVYTQEFQPLNMPWYVLIPPSILLGIGPLLITTTTLEFISAQSPHSMTGVLIGLFFAIQGIFQLLGYITTLPFSLSYSWINEALPPFFSCGSVYLLFTSAVGLFDFGLFSLTAKYYKYRKRDDDNFNQADVEEVYIRYLSQTASANSSDNNIED